MLRIELRLVPRLFILALTVALFAIRTLHVFALLIRTTARLSLTLLIAFLVRLLRVVGHERHLKRCPPLHHQRRHLFPVPKKPSPVSALPHENWMEAHFAPRARQCLVALLKQQLSPSCKRLSLRAFRPLAAAR